MSIATNLAVAALTISVVLTPASAHTFTRLYTFKGKADGADPSQLFYHDGELYGTTPAGGYAPNGGTVFKLNVATGQLRVLHKFKVGKDGALPYGSVIYNDGMLYGTTIAGGALGCTVYYYLGCGTIYSVNAETGTETILYEFGPNPGNDKSFPGQLIYVAGILYGTTLSGGATGKGSVFSFNLATNAFATLYSFTGGTDGASPNTQLIYKNGLLYGTTADGGIGCGQTAGCGVLFSIDPATGTESVVHTFRTGINEGRHPYSNLAYYNGWFFGDTSAGGHCRGSKCSVTFEIKAATGREKVLNAPAGYQELTEQGGNLYETFLAQGRGMGGELIKVDLKSGLQKVIHQFIYGHDCFPSSALVYHSGSFYGTTSLGGKADAGTIFKYTE